MHGRRHMHTGDAALSERRILETKGRPGNMNLSFKLFVLVALLVFLPLLIAYRMGYFGQKGQFKPSKKVNTQFRKNELPAQYRYAELSDSAKGTYAIVGLNPDYTIDSAGWTAFEPDEGALDRLMLRMVAQNAYTAEGFEIVNPAKETVGIFYSPLPDPVVHFKSGRFLKFTLDIPGHIKQER